METARDPIVIPESGYDVVQWSFDIDGDPVPFLDARLQVRSSPKRDGDLLAELSVANGLVTITELAAATVIACEFTEALVAEIPTGTWWYDLRVLDMQGHPHYPLNGPCEIPDTVTAPASEEVPT